LDTVVDIAAHTLSCSLVMNTLEQMAGIASPVSRDRTGAGVDSPVRP